MIDREEKKLVETYLNGIWETSTSRNHADKSDTEGLIYEGALAAIRAMGYTIARIGGQHVVTKRRAV